MRSTEDQARHTGRGPGRPPNLKHRAAVLQATRELVAELGYENLTFEAVAQRANLYRRYVNRSWGSKAELVRDAIFDDLPGFVVPDTGSLEGDLAVFIRQFVDLNFRPEVKWGLPSVQVALTNDAKLMADTEARFVEPTVDALRAILERGVANGELEAMPDPDVVLSCLTGPIQQLALRGLLNRGELVDHMMRLLTRGLLHA